MKKKSEILIETFRYWSGRLGLKPNFIITKDNRYDCHVAIVDYDTNNPRLVYNAKKLGRWCEAYIVCAVFHEMGHIMNNLPYSNEEEEIYSEMRAEMFALTMLKFHYPEFYKENNRLMKIRLKDKRWCKKNKAHYTAFKLIKEYK